MVLIWWLLIVLALVVLFVIFLFNSLISLKNQIENSWAQIDVQLKRRADLIPNLVNAVKGYMKHEKGVLTEVTKARTAFLNAGADMGKKAKASDIMSNALKSLFAVSENYPKLQASQNFLQLQEEITGTENKVSYARQHYNDMVMMFNIKIQKFPNNTIAGILGFSKKQMFEAGASERKAVKVDF
jgi:LemA protein